MFAASPTFPSGGRMSRSDRMRGASRNDSGSEPSKALRLRARHAIRPAEPDEKGKMRTITIGKTEIKTILADITKITFVGAIVNAANNSLLGGGGVDGAIHRAAGPELKEECRTLHGCPTGEAKLTGAYKLPCRYVIHTVGPIWRDGKHGEQALLESCYRNSLALAVETGCESVAFPLISAGAYGYPKDQAIRVAVDTIGAFLAQSEADLLVYLVVFGHGAFRLSEKLYSDIRSFIDENYVDAHTNSREENRRRLAARQSDFDDAMPVCGAQSAPSAAPKAPRPRPGFLHPPAKAAQEANDLEAVLGQIDESFQQMLLRKIDEKGMTDAQCYKKANVDRRLFSRIRGNPLYKPSKATAIAFAVALELPLSETKDMLMKAGYALSHSSKFDLIVEYFIRSGVYDVLRINEALFEYDQSLLGGQ